MTIETSAKQTLSFDISKAKVSISKASIEVNDIITITYTGELSGTDTSKCVVSVVDDSGPDYKSMFGNGQ